MIEKRWKNLTIVFWCCGQKNMFFFMFLAMFLDGFFCTLNEKFFCALNQNGVPWSIRVYNMMKKGWEKKIAGAYLPEIPSRLRKEDVEIFGFWCYSKTDNFAVQVILLCYFSKNILVQIKCVF